MTLFKTCKHALPFSGPHKQTHKGSLQTRIITTLVILNLNLKGNNNNIENEQNGNTASDFTAAGTDLLLLCVPHETDR